MCFAVLPLVVQLPRKRVEDKKFYLNLNSYRNSHYQILNNAKKEFAQAIHPQIAGRKLTPPVKITYGVHLRQRRGDLMNIVAVVDKFFCDAMVNAGCLPDDDYKNIVSVAAEFRGVDRHYPRAVVEIEEVEG